MEKYILDVFSKLQFTSIFIAVISGLTVLGFFIAYINIKIECEQYKNKNDIATLEVVSFWLKVIGIIFIVSLSLAIILP